MKKLLQKIIYQILSIQEKTLKYRLDKSLKNTYTTKTSKTILSATEHITLKTQTEKKKELVRKNILEILKNCKNNPQELLEYIKNSGTKVCRIANADKLLNTIGENEGFITELEGLKALYINLLTNSKLSLKSKPVFIMRNGNIEPLLMIHNFYKWYSMKAGLAGFDYKSQEKFKKYIKNINADTSSLSTEDIINLQEAVDRDKEATAFCLEIAQQTKGAENVLNKISTEGSAEI